MVQLLGIFGFLSFGWADVLDILMVAAIIYFLIRSIRGDSTVLNIVLVLVLLLVAQAVVKALNMRMMTVLLSTLLDVGVLAIIILFQPEIRHLLNRLAVNSGLAKRTGELFNRLLGIKEEKLGSRAVVELSEAVRAMAAEHTGALIVLQKKSALDEYIATGDRFDADINRRLVMNIFFKNSPLHDGAMIIQGDRIVAARCQLPMTDRTDIPAHYGMRHRAAIGMSENSDAVVVVVSEETGSISVAVEGILKRHLTAETFERILRNELLHRLHPKAILPVKVNDTSINSSGQITLIAFLMAYFVLCFIAYFIMILVGVDSTNSFTIALSCASNVGPTLGLEIGPTMSWGILPAFVKWILSALMLMGRLEIFTVLVIFTSAFWKNN